MAAFRSLLPGFVAGAMLLLGSLLGSSQENSAPRENGWRSDPIRWLMEPSELRSWKHLEANDETVVFLEAFWNRRDPGTGADGSASHSLFERRSVEADALFDGEGQRGILTHRGRAYLLIGSPNAIRQGYRRTPVLGAMEAGRGRSFATRPLLVETWSWRPEDISPELRGHLRKRRWKPSLEIRFKVDHGRYTLMDGEELLRLAARSWVRSDR